MTLNPLQRRWRSAFTQGVAARSAGLALALVTAALISGCAAVAAAGASPDHPVPARYRSLYTGLNHSRVSLPPLLAGTRLGVVERTFPPGSVALPPGAAAPGGPQLYVGFTLAPLSCRDDYLAKAAIGPGAVLALTVVQRHLPAGVACFELIGPLMYQVVALPLHQFPGHIRLLVEVRRPLGIGDVQEVVRLP